MRLVLVALLLVATAACGAYSFPGSSPAAGTVHGTVLVYPCAPVEQQGQPCKGRIAAGVVLIFTGDSTTVSLPTDSNGAYSVSLPAGTYKVSVKPIARIISGPVTVNVPAGGSVQADYVVDSGIRAPGPATAIP